MNAVGASRRAVLAMIAVVALAGCQTIPKSGFSAAQRAMLAKHGFEERDGNYLLGFNNRLLFPFDSSEIDPAKQVMLRELGGELASVGIASAGVEGHASAEGDAQHNLRLSGRRAEAVRDALVTGGLDGARMRVRAMGALDPVASNAEADGRRQNRRVVIIVTPADAMAF
jgi:OOP family OmpA-OmpF porin